MHETTIKLDDQPLPAPKAVDLEEAAANREVDVALRLRQIGTREHHCEPCLELFLGDSSDLLLILNDRPQCSRPTTPGVSLQQVMDRELVREPTNFDLVECRSQADAWSAMAARSSSVRDTDVTGIPSTDTTSSGPMVEQCARSPGRDRNFLGLVTSIAIEVGGNSPQRAAAER